MTSLTDLREVVDVVIGVDTHVQTHSAAVIDSATGGVLGEITVAATAAGYLCLHGGPGAPMIASSRWRDSLRRGGAPFFRPARRRQLRQAAGSVAL